MGKVLCHFCIVLAFIVFGVVLVVNSKHTSNSDTQNNRNHEHHHHLKHSGHGSDQSENHNRDHINSKHSDSDKGRLHSHNHHLKHKGLEPDNSNVDYHLRHKDRSGNHHTHENNVILDRPFESVSRDVFESHLSKAKSAADVLKIFLGDTTLTDDQVNSIMFMKKHNVVFKTDTPDREPDYMMSDVEANESTDRERAYKHFSEMESHPMGECTPKPVIERVEEVYSDSVRIHLPKCTVVHRCQNYTSCCPKGFMCGPKEDEIEIIERPYMVFEQAPGSDQLRPAEQFTEIKVHINHTRCECKPIEINSNCHRECPSQFNKHRDGVDCQCICHGNRKCHRIQRGWIPLDEEDLVCIKGGKCIEPDCQFGDFNINTGFCPKRSDRNRRG